LLPALARPRRDVQPCARFRPGVVALPRPPRAPLIGLVLAVAVVLLAVLWLNPGTAAAIGPSITPTAAEPFQWPLAPPHPLLRPFQPPSTPYGPGHRGVDLGGQEGEQVLAAGSGLVLYAGPLADRSLVSIEHASGLRTTYEPVQPTVRVGQQVRRGQVIGVLLGSHPGCPATAPTVCLHWGVHRQDVYLDPVRLLDLGHVRLLPWPTGVP
jgi:murein DD-endopeptidase MepM/ murein hydrolase activator NlpD